MKVIVNRKQYENILKETRGYSKTLEKWADYVTDETLPLIMRQDVSEDVYLLTKLSLKLKDKDFYKEIPIDSLILSVIIIDSESEDAQININYVPFYTQIIENDNGGYDILDVEFEVVMTLPKNRENIDISTLHYYMSSYLSHEFMHVNEWINRNLESPKELKDCLQVYTKGNINGDAVDRIGFLLYVSLSYEQNAFIQQVGTMISKKNPQNKNEFMVYLKENPFYYFVQKMLEFDKDNYLNEINSLPKDRISVLNEIILCYYQEEGKIRKMKSVDTFLKDIDKKFNFVGEYLNKKLLRLITLI